MNIFKIGLFISVLVFNLSCAIIPDDQAYQVEEVSGNNYAIMEDDLNVTDQSFIDLEALSNSNIENLLSYLEGHHISDESTFLSVDQLPAELEFTAVELEEIELVIERLEFSTEQKEILHSFINHLRTDRPY